MATTPTTFPLPPDYFGPLTYSRDELAQWKRRVVGLVDQTLHEEYPVFASSYTRVDAQQWKLLKTKDHLRLFQPRSGSKATATTPRSCVLAVGTIDGTLEDVIYGIHNTTTRDLRVTRRFLTDKSLDSAVLHVFENGTDGDPFRSLALKWRAVETPVGSLVKNRDGCVLEYMGISVDAHGRRYAFQVSENLDHPICPPFTAQGVVRADVHIRAIYRELDAGRVGVYFYAGYDMSGQIPKLLASWTAASVAFSVVKSVECAEAKKLTALALTDFNTTLRHKARRLQRRLSTEPVCSICCAAPTYLASLTSRSPLAECQICAAVMCTKCSSRKFLLAEARSLRIHCCKQCIVAAKSLAVDPRQPLPLASLRGWITRGDIRGDGITRRGDDDRRTWSICEPRDTMLLSLLGEPDSPTMSATYNVKSPRLSVDEYAVRSHRRQGSETQHSVRACELSTPPVTRARRHSVEPHNNAPLELWMRMLELQTAAEQTYRITKEVNKLMVPDTDTPHSTSS